jgi:hypothetical protein
MVGSNYRQSIRFSNRLTTLKFSAMFLHEFFSKIWTHAYQWAAPNGENMESIYFLGVGFPRLAEFRLFRARAKGSDKVSRNCAPHTPQLLDALRVLLPPA